MRFLPLLVIICLLYASCSKEGKSGNQTNGTNSSYVIGKNRFTVNVDNDDREYYVHVPSGYNSKNTIPVVIMLHGTSQNGLDMYENSGWKEVGDAETILTVYPSSWTYCVTADGQQKTTTKWNSQPAEWSFCNGEKPRDDIKFFTSVVSELKSKFNVDSKRIYLVGFSSGSQMAGKCTVDLSDVFAAIVESAGSLYSPTPSNPNLSPKRKLPIYFQKGNEDYGPGGSGPAAPMGSLGKLLTTPDLPYLNGNLYDIALTNTKVFGLSPTFKLSGDSTTVVTATYTSANAIPNNLFIVNLIKGLKHAYPNGSNHPYMAAQNNWAWLKQYSL